MREMRRSADAVGDTSRRVAAQYETAPYPRWTRLGMSLREGELRRSLEAYFKPSHLAFMDHPFEVLVAGCGTGMDAIQLALGYGQSARVVALDLSLASLAYASRMADRLGARNIQFMQADIQELGEISQFLSRFRVIECSGVLHHMADPFQGWRSLNKCLAAGGIMRIGLYSSMARSNLTALRSDPAYPGPGCDDDQLRTFRHLLIARPDGQLGSELKTSSDFYSASGFATWPCMSANDASRYLRSQAFSKSRGSSFVVFNRPLSSIYCAAMIHESYGQVLWRAGPHLNAQFQFCLPACISSGAREHSAGDRRTGQRAALRVAPQCPRDPLLAAGCIGSGHRPKRDRAPCPSLPEWLRKSAAASNPPPPVRLTQLSRTSSLGGDASTLWYRGARLLFAAGRTEFRRAGVSVLTHFFRRVRP